MSDPRNYAIGWICAIQTEYVAAKAFLDEKHPLPEFVSKRDPNTYTLGRMGSHNVVIVVLPKGQYGLSSATTVAADMCNSFPNIRVGLMVGIGGGVPSRKQDVRLGDVVVGVPGHGHGGVRQYSLLTALEDKTLKTVCHLNGPPQTFLRAISGLSAEHDIQGHTLDRSINAVLDKLPSLRNDCQRPQSSLDRLYLSDYIHVGDKSSTCAQSCGDTPSNLITRTPRDDEDEPSIHYGLIASDTTLCKDSRIRDKLAADGALCIEMEAAGLMNYFPCLVVRGVADYADTHKNDQWHGYAAMAAAAYAKDLLRHVPSTMKQQERGSCKDFKMVIPYKGAQIPISFASCSIPMKIKASLPDKLKSIRNAGFDGIELSMPDIISYGELLNGSSPVEDDYDTLADVAKQIKSVTDELGLKIMMLQPFANFEGWNKDTHGKQRQQAFDKAKGWIKVMEAAGITLLQVGSSDSEGISSSFDDLASDLAELADLLAEKNFSIAYENWCWATHAPTWKTVWQIVQKADRPNIGLCLDTFQTAGYEWGDPTTNDGLTPASSSDERQKRWEASLHELAATVPAEKIYLLQISDAYKMDPPIEDVKDEQGSRPRARWSHDYRPLPCDGGYLPVQDMMAAVLKTGFRSWLSVEVFDGLEGENTDMNEYTQMAFESVKKLIDFNV
ncbi:unnamed protein product [Fusarium graminearum]|nr:unnamed protein product [Fusarium graminearum]